MKKTIAVVVGVSLSFILTACTKSTNDPRDPYEKFNRTVFAFNQGFDKAVFRPTARVYMMALPSPIRRGVGNAFSNVSEVAVLPNDLLQGKVRYFFRDLFRIFINTTFGLGGLFDVAAKAGLNHHEQGYGATLAYYSPKGSQSPYLVLPILGSWTFRTALGLLMGYYSEPVSWIGSNSWRYSLVGVFLVSKRADLMVANQAIDEAFDPYILVRNAFFQHDDRQMALLMTERKPGDTLPAEDQESKNPTSAE
jgi:phospholipid-binding lipoprotein MlaA